jgi:hypothetical protein
MKEIILKIIFVLIVPLAIISIIYLLTCFAFLEFVPIEEEMMIFFRIVYLGTFLMFVTSEFS